MFLQQLYVLLLFLLTCISESLEETCCLKKVVKDAGDLSGVYSLIKEVSLSILPEEDQPICQTGCLYKQEGGDPDEHFCFKRGGNQQTVCSIQQNTPEVQNLLLKREDIKEEAETLNMTLSYKVEEIEQEKEALEDVNLAKEKVEQLLSASRWRRDASGGTGHCKDGEVEEDCGRTVVKRDGGCGRVVLLFNLMIEGTQVVLNARLIFQEESVSCQPNEADILRNNMTVFDEILLDMNQTVFDLQKSVDSLTTAVLEIMEELRELETLLEEEYQVEDLNAAAGVLDDNNELPVELSLEQYIHFDHVDEIEELPLKLDFNIL